MRRGATFLEILIAVFMISMVLGPMVLAFIGSVRGTDHTNRRVVAIALTNQALERFKSEPFARLVMLFGGSGQAGARALAEDPTLASDLVGAAFFESVSAYRLSGRFEEVVKDREGLLTITCRFPSQRSGTEATLAISKVVVDFARVRFEGEES